MVTIKMTTIIPISINITITVLFRVPYSITNRIIIIILTPSEMSNLSQYWGFYRIKTNKHRSGTLVDDDAPFSAIGMTELRLPHHTGTNDSISLFSIPPSLSQY